MAKISSCYQLCPFMDQKSFLGVSDDCKSGYVIVTLGKNIVIRYRISNQRQVNSWNTTVKMSAPVVFDKKSKHYVGVFNTDCIQRWQESDVDLHKVKKYKFRTSIHSVLSNANVDTLVVVFKNGRVAPLESAMENRKTDVHGTKEGTFAAGEVIDDAYLLSLDGNLIVALITSIATEGQSRLHMRPVQEGLFTPFSIPLNRNSSAKLMGYSFMTQDSLQFLTIWSDGSLYAQEVYLSTLDSLQAQYPGQLIMNLSAVDTKLKVAILPLGTYHIAVYGSDPGEEGALLTIVNVRHRLVQCKYFFKLYCTSPRLWSGGPTNLLLIVGNNLAVAHYRLVTQQLAALIGTQTETVDKPIAVNWSTKKVKKSNSVPEKVVTVSTGTPKTKDELKAKVGALIEEGLSEAVICERLFPGLLQMEKGNIELIFALYESLSDIPAEYYFKTLDICLNDSRNENWKGLLGTVFSRSIQNDNRTLSIAQSEINLSTALVLVSNLTERLIATPCDIQLIEWATFILDAFCQQFLLSKDDSVINILKELKNVVDNQMNSMSVWQELIPLINIVKFGKQESKVRNDKFMKKSAENSIYLVEDVPLLPV